MLYRSRARRKRRRATIKRVQTEATQIKGPQKGEKRATIKRAETEAIQIKGLQRQEKGDNNESGNKGHTDQWSAEKGEGQQ